MSSRVAEATRNRILSAAVTEFARYGYSGARIDRIAAGASANKSMIYVYFGNKDQLFDAVIDAAIGDLHQTVPFTPNDLPGYGGRLFDFLMAHPVEIRIDAWRRLERPANTSLEQEIFAEKITALDAVRPQPWTSQDSADVLVTVISLAWSWVTVPESLGVLASQEIAAQRQQVVQSIEKLYGATTD